MLCSSAKADRHPPAPRVHSFHPVRPLRADLYSAPDACGQNCARLCAVGSSRPTRVRSTETWADPSRERPRARRERPAAGGRPRIEVRGRLHAASAVHMRVHEECEHRRTPAAGALPTKAKAESAVALWRGLGSPEIPVPPQNRSAAGGTDRSRERPCARSERLVVGDRQRAATGAHFRVREDCEHCRAPSTSRAVAPRRYQ